jgi:subtilisin-like proprotein convertase family protein
MKSYTFISTLLLIFLFSVSSHAQLWKQKDISKIRSDSKAERLIIPEKFELMEVDFEQMKDQLAIAQKGGQDLIIELPIADGTIQKFNVQEASVFSEKLAARYPDIKSYKGKGVDDPSSYIRFGYSHKGFHAIMFSSKYGTMYIDTYARGNTQDYIVYHKKDYLSDQTFECLVEEDTRELVEDGISSQKAGDCQLRTYRLALACTGEYATFHGGTLEDVMAEYNIAMTRVNGIYEKDISVTMVLIDNTDQLIFFDGGTDPYTNNSGGIMLNENQTTIDDIIGTDNYDIGHVFSTGGGGIAQLRSPCGGGKARGVTGLGFPVGDPFYVDYVAHEMGHQYGGNHTQNNSCNRNGATAMEPGSASTIMGYAGICTPNVQNNSDDHFHAISIQEMSEFIVNGNGNSCAEITALDNTPPTVSLLSTSYTVPISTPLALTAIATDADGDALTYNWEQMDNEVGEMPPQESNVVGPMFRSNSSLESPTRYLPSINAIINNVTPEWEVLPAVERSMSWRVTVRDNNVVIGCTAEEDMNINFSETAGPFLVNEPNTAVEWNASNIETVTWDVAGTDMAPVSCAEVDIYLSKDGGNTYPVLIAEGVPNSGSLDIVVPDEQTSQARIMVKCHDNIFFDISDQNFTITTPFSINVSSSNLDICAGEDVSLEITSQAFDGFSEEIELSLMGLPAGVTANFGSTSITPPEGTTLELTGFPNEQAEYNISLIGTAMDNAIAELINVNVGASTLEPMVLTTPVDGAVDQNESLVFEWNAVPGISSYNIELSTTPSFMDIVDTQDNILTNSFSTENLQSNTVYYWRVIPNALCATPEFSDIFAFQTAGENCDRYTSEDIPVIISSSEEDTITSILTLPDVGNFAYVKLNVDIEHSWIGDMIIDLIAPDSTIFSILDRPGVPDSNFGCGEENINATFRDDAERTAVFIEENCESIQGEYQAIAALNDIASSPVAGDWTLGIQDLFNADGGSLNSWSVEFCNENVGGSPDLTTNTLFVNKSTSGDINQMLLNTVDMESDKVIYSLLSTPISGDIEIDRMNDGNYEALVTGSSFTQDEVNNNLLRYTHLGDDQEEDSFLFDVIDANNRWIHNEVFSVFILQDDFSSIAEISQEIQCTGDDNGIINISVFGGLEPYEYSIDNGITYQLGSEFSGLNVGSYTVLVKDATGLEISTNTIELEDPTPITITTIMDGYNIIVNADGGTGSYEYSADGVAFQMSNTFADIGNGMFTITVVDANGCMQSENIEVMIAAISYNVTTLNACFDTNLGSISIDDVTGGIPPYEYSIDGVDYQEGPFFLGVEPGNYETYVRDSGGKILNMDNVEIVANTEIIISALGEDGTITVDVTGGAEPFLYSIDNGETYQESNVFEDLDFGEYTVVVLDAFACSSSMDVIIILSDIFDLEDKFSFKVFPNPVANDLSIQLDGAYLVGKQIGLKIADNLGRIILQEQLSSSSSIRRNMDLSELSSGTYFILIDTEEKIARAKFIKL